MKVEIKRLYSLEVEDALNTYRPLEVDNFGTWIRMSVGPAGQPGMDNFELFVCTPIWLSKELEEDSTARWGRHTLIVKVYDFTAISNELERLVQRCGGQDWQGIALKISHFAAWEFEDYRM
jgi:hypothetical protein